MRPRSTLLLVALAALAVAGIWLFERDRPGTDARRAMEGRLLPGIEAGDVTRVVIERQDDATIELVRGTDGWRLESPVRDRADTARVEGLVRALLDARAETSVPADEVRDGDRATGLDDAAPRVLLTAGDAERVLVIGHREIPGGLRYVRTEGDDLHLVGAALVDALPKTADAVRDRALTDLATVDLDRVEIARDGTADLVLARRDPGADGAWWIEAPFADVADRSAASALVREILGLRAATILDAPPPGEALAAPLFTIALVAAGPAENDADPGGAGEENAVNVEEEEEDAPRRVILRIGDVVPGTAVRLASVSDRPATFEVEADGLVEALTRPADALRSMSALDEAAWDVARVTLTRGPETVTVERVDGEFEVDKKWRLVEPEGVPFDPAAFDARLGSLVRIDALRIADGVDARAAGLDAPVATLAIATDGGDEIRLEIGGTAGEDGVYARRSGRPAILVIAAGDAARIDPSELAHDGSPASAPDAAGNGSP